MSHNQLISACDALIRREAQRSSSKAVGLAKKFVARTRDEKASTRQAAFRALGFAQLVYNDYKAAKEAYLKARELTGHDVIARGRIDRALVDVYMYLGNLKEARRRAKLSIRTFTRLREPAELAKTKVNYANLLHRQDRHSEAHDLYEEAGRYFRKQGQSIAVALCGYNQANTLVQLFDFKKAEPLYIEARKIFAEQEHELWANNCLNGLAWLHMLEGNFHKALHELEECELDFRRAGQRREVVLCLLDRSEVYLGLNLFVEARNTARDAGRIANRLGIDYEYAKASFFLAKASYAMGRPADAKRALQRAESIFADGDNRAFLAATRLLGAQIEQSGRTDGKAIQLAHDSFAKAQLPLWEAICDLQILSENPTCKAAHQRLTKNRAVKSVPHLRARWHTICGERELTRNRPRAAVRHWTKAADLLDNVRQKLPPVDLRDAFFKGHSEPHRLLISQTMTTDPLEASAWSERYKTAGEWTRETGGSESVASRQRAEDSLSALAAQVTQLCSRFGTKRGERGAGTQLPSSRLEKLQQQVRASISAIEHGSSSQVDHISLIKSHLLRASKKQPVIQFHVGERDLVAFIHDNGASRMHNYHDGIEVLDKFVGQWRFLVEHYSQTGDQISPGDREDEAILLQRLGNWLLPPLEIAAASSALILPEGCLANIPWYALTIDKQPLIMDRNIILAPSLRHHMKAVAQDTRSSKIEVFVGSTVNLGDPARDYRRILSSPGVTVHRPCRRSDWPNETEAGIWHYVGHAESRGDNPAYSCLWLEDGPMFAADFSLKSNRIGLVTLAACRTGQQSTLAGEESIGLVRAFLEMGASNVIASNWAVKDATTAQCMDRFYEYYLNDNPLSESFRKAALSVRESYPSAYHWSAFSVFGAGA